MRFEETERFVEELPISTRTDGGRERPADSRTTPRPLLAVCGAVLLAALVGLLGPFVSPRLKLIGLYPTALAAVAGYGAALLLSHVGAWRVRTRNSVRQNGRGTGWLPGLATLLMLIVIAGYFGVSLLRFRNERVNELEQHLKAQPGGALIWQDLQSGRTTFAPAEAKFMEAYQALYQNRRQETFNSFLETRLLNVRTGGVPQPWPWIVAGLECLAMLLAGVATTYYTLRGLTEREALTEGTLSAPPEDQRK